MTEFILGGKIAIPGYVLGAIANRLPMGPGMYVTQVLCQMAEG